MPPLRNFTTMSGNFDCPEASEYPTYFIQPSAASSSRSPFRPDHPEFRPNPSEARALMDRLPPPPEGSTDLNTLRRRIHDLRRTAGPDSVSARAVAEGSAAAASARARWARHSSAARHTRSRLHQHRLQRRAEDDSIGTVQEAVDRLNEANSDLSSILDQPLPQIVSSDDWGHLTPNTELMGRRHKRRKLDNDALDNEPPPKYGYFGQMVPGRLKMSILGCDGGYLAERDENSLHRHYSPENVLRNDKSVYCTEKDQCNIILKHWKETPFSITKIVIKSPDAGFPAPIQEGLVFVAMSADSLLARTAQYQISRTASGFDRSGHQLREASPEQRGATEHAIRHTNLLPFGYSTDVGRPPSRRRNLSRYSTMVAAPDLHDLASVLNSSSWNSYAPHCTQSLPQRQYTDEASLLNSSHPSEFRVTASCDDPSGDEEEATSPAILLDRQRRRNLSADWPSSDEDDTDGSSHRAHRMRSSPREIKLIPPSSESDRPSSQALEPHARFFIERKRNVVSLKFHPPV